VHVEVLLRRIDVVIAHVLGTITAGRHRTAVGPLEKPSIAVVFLDAEAALVHQPMVRGAQEHQVRETGLAAGRPVLDMMGIDEARAGSRRTVSARRAKARIASSVEATVPHRSSRQRSSTRAAVVCKAKATNSSSLLRSATRVSALTLE
jgi:hypothetical protein